MSWNVKLAARSKEKLVEAVSKAGAERQLPAALAACLGSLASEFSTDGHVWDGIGSGKFEIALAKRAG